MRPPSPYAVSLPHGDDGHRLGLEGEAHLPALNLGRDGLRGTKVAFWKGTYSIFEAEDASTAAGDRACSASKRMIHLLLKE